MESSSKLEQWQLRTVCFTLILVTISLTKPTTAEIPGCLYEDTVNITGSQRLENGTYFYNNKYMIPEELVGYYDFEETSLNQHVQVERHLRGCICRVTSCIQLCCAPNEEKAPRMRSCIERRNTTAPINPLMNITQHDNSEKEHDVLNDFAIQTRLPCATGIVYGEFSLYENGALRAVDLLTVQLKTYAKSDYCIIPAEEDGTRTLTLLPLICINESEQEPETLERAVIY